MESFLFFYFRLLRLGRENSFFSSPRGETLAPADGKSDWLTRHEDKLAWCLLADRSLAGIKNLAGVQPAFDSCFPLRNLSSWTIHAVQSTQDNAKVFHEPENTRVVDGSFLPPLSSPSRGLFFFFSFPWRFTRQIGAKKRWRGNFTKKLFAKKSFACFRATKMNRFYSGWRETSFGSQNIGEHWSRFICWIKCYYLWHPVYLWIFVF